MSKLNNAKQVYQSIEPPAKLNYVVNHAIDSSLEHGNKKRHNQWDKVLVGAAMSVFLLFVVLLNTNPAFAQSVYEIPVVGNIARVFTFHEYHEVKDNYGIQIKQPAVEGTKNKDLEKRINAEIQTRVDQIKKEAEQRSEQAKKDALAQGKTEAEAQYFTVHVDYEIKTDNDSILSFVVNKTESFANTYTTQIFYNIDLKTGKEIKISDILGEDYKKIVSESLKKQIRERMQKDPTLMYYDFENDPTIQEEVLNNLKYYINPAGNVVVSFDKGEFAPPPVGIQEFEIKK